jgi:formate hydrogenlyase subunit 6/NADH:ubiquinone oxidoreductase subunit I
MGKIVRPGSMLSLVFSSVFRKPATRLYPYVKIEVVDKFRGKLKYNKERCNGCMLCMKDCPSNAITIVKVAEKEFKAVLSLDKCVFCGQCVDSCPKDALECTKDFELAHFDRKYLQVEI